MRKHIANMVTSIRILCSIWMFFSPVFSPPFYIAYLICGVSDMADGFIARKTKSATAFGSQLDSVADFIFATVAFIKILPQIRIPGWLWGCIFIISAIKIANMIWGFIYKKRLVFEHTVMNKITGLLLFLLPLTLSIIELKYSANVLCIIAAFSAIQESHYIKTGKKTASVFFLLCVVQCSVQIKIL